MTAVLAIDFYYQIIVIADCRVTWLNAPINLQDNLQKVYPCGPTGVLGFAGGIRAAKSIIEHVAQEGSKKPLPPSAQNIAEDVSIWARKSYSLLPKKDQIETELMYAAADYGNVTLASSNVIFTKNVLVKMTSPKFEPIPQTDAIQLGYAVKYPMEYILLNRDSFLNIGLEQPNGLRFQAAMTMGQFSDSLAKLGENTVGGMFSVGIINARGVSWIPYSIGDEVELKIEDGRFVQYDHRDGKRVPLKTILEFNANRPDIGNLYFKTPDNY